MIRNVLFYETETGTAPVEKFIRKLSKNPRKRLLEAFHFLQENQPTSPDMFKKMVNTDDLWEVRVRSDGNIYRVICFFDGAQLIIAAHGFQKKTQKTPTQAIQTATKRKKDYFERKKR